MINNFYAGIGGPFDNLNAAAKSIKALNARGDTSILERSFRTEATNASTIRACGEILYLTF